MRSITQACFSVAAVGICLLLSGCSGDASSPEGVLQMMGNAVRSGSLSEFQNCLTGDALKQDGNATTLAEMRRETSGLELSLGDAIQVSEQSPQDGVTLEIYDVPVLSRKAGTADTFTKFMDAQVVCQTGGANAGTSQEALAKSAFFMAPSTSYNSSDSARRQAPTLCRVSELTPS